MARDRWIKAQAYGNDFLIAPVTGPAPPDGAEQARQACDRHHGLGADGLIFARLTEEGAETILFNHDGSSAEVSGNGTRCVATWLALVRQLQPGSALVIGTRAGAKRFTLLERGIRQARFAAEMGQPTAIREVVLDLEGVPVAASLLNMGNPQCVVFGDLTETRLQTLGRGLAAHPAFPHGTNVELATLLSVDRVRILIWERGVGPTASSGTGSCAAAVAAAAHHGASRRVEVIAPGGSQLVEWTDDGVTLEGSASLVAYVEWPAITSG